MRDTDNNFQFKLILFLVFLAFVIFGAMLGIVDLGKELSEPVPTWLWLIG